LVGIREGEWKIKFRFKSQSAKSMVMLQSVVSPDRGGGLCRRGRPLDESRERVAGRGGRGFDII